MNDYGYSELMIYEHNLLDVLFTHMNKNSAQHISIKSKREFNEKLINNVYEYFFTMVK